MVLLSRAVESFADPRGGVGLSTPPLGWRMGRGRAAGRALSCGRLSQHSCLGSLSVAINVLVLTPQMSFHGTRRLDSIMAYSDNLTWLATHQ